MSNLTFWLYVWASLASAAALYGWLWGLGWYLDARGLRRERLRYLNPTPTQAGADKLMADVLATNQEDGAV